jgi:uncharacterized protein (TIGR01777 family)
MKTITARPGVSSAPGTIRRRTVTLKPTVTLPVSAAEAYSWHKRPGAFERLLPPWVNLNIVKRNGGIEDGARVVLRIPCGPLRLRWELEHRHCRAGKSFSDVQIRGPFSRYAHTHRFDQHPDGSSELIDHLEYVLPFGYLGRALAGPFVRRSLDRLFAYRHAVTRDDLGQHFKNGRGGPLRILITGSSGFVGSSLVPFLTSGGHHVVRLIRRGSAAAEGSSVWDPDRCVIEPDTLEGFDAIVHLAGESIAAGRWTKAKKEHIRRSRVEPTRTLSEVLAGLKNPPPILVTASAIGYYGDRGGDLLTEKSHSADGFLADVAHAWEDATRPAAEAGIRVVNLRFGMVLGQSGGALAKMLRPFRMGAGGRLGSGRQYMSWISLDDAIGAIDHALSTDELHGAVNAVSPHPVTNAEFTRTVGRVLSRPTIFPVPAIAARLAFGEMADALLLASTRVQPARLIHTGFKFRHPDLESALRRIWSRRCVTCLGG